MAPSAPSTVLLDMPRPTAIPAASPTRDVVNHTSNVVERIRTLRTIGIMHQFHSSGGVSGCGRGGGGEGQRGACDNGTPHDTRTCERMDQSSTTMFPDTFRCPPGPLAGP
eukprot:7269708-Prymnesium_polylepis.1